MKERQHIWLGPDATSFDEMCEECLRAKESLRLEACVVHGTLRREADVGFTTCRRGHRIVMRRVRLKLVV